MKSHDSTYTNSTLLLDAVRNHVKNVVVACRELMLKMKFKLKEGLAVSVTGKRYKSHGGVIDVEDKGHVNELKTRFRLKEVRGEKEDGKVSAKTSAK